MKARVKGEGVNEQSVLVPHLSARHPSRECAATPRVADSISKCTRTFRVSILLASVLASEIAVRPFWGLFPCRFRLLPAQAVPRQHRGDRSTPALRAGLPFEGVRHTQLQLGASCCGVPCGPALWAFWTRLLASLWWGVIYAAVRHQICRATEPCSTFCCIFAATACLCC